MRPRPLSRRRMKVRGDMFPREIVKRGGHRFVTPIPHQPEHAGQFLEHDDHVGRAVVFRERSLLHHVGVERPQSFLRIGAQLGQLEFLRRDQGHRRAQHRDVRIAGPDISPLDGLRRVNDRFADLIGQRRLEVLAMIHPRHQERHRAEVRPVPVRRRHLRQRFLQIPRPETVGLARRVLVLKPHHHPDDFARALDAPALAAVQQRRRVIERSPCRMNVTGLQGRVITGSAGRRRHEHLRKWIVALILLRQDGEQPAPLLFRRGATRRGGKKGVWRGEPGEAQTRGDTGDESSARKHGARLRTRRSESNLFPARLRELMEPRCGASAGACRAGRTRCAPARRERRHRHRSNSPRLDRGRT